jgi:hypothetical protein
MCGLVVHWIWRVLDSSLEKADGQRYMGIHQETKFCSTVDLSQFFQGIKQFLK